MVRRKANKTVERVLVVYYIHTAIYMYKQAVLTIGCTSPACGGVYRGYRTYPPYYSGTGRGVGRLHRGPPELWHQRRQCQRSNLADSVWWRCRVWGGGGGFCGGCEGEVIQGHAKTPPQGKIKTVLVPILDLLGSLERRRHQHV